MTRYRTKERDLLGSSLGEIRGVGLGRLTTPMRVLNSSEAAHMERLRHGGFVDHNSVFPHQVFEIIKNLKKDSLLSLHGNTEVFRKIEADVSELADRQPDKAAFLKINTNAGTVIPQTASNAVVDICMRAGFEWLTVLDKHPDSNVETAIRRYSNCVRYSEQNRTDERKFTLWAGLDIKSNRFRDKMSMYLENDVRFFNIDSGSFDLYRPNWNFLMGLASKYDDVCIYMSNIDRKWTGDRITSIIHLLPLYNVSLMSLKSRQVIVMNPQLPGLFDRKTLGILSRSEYVKRYGENAHSNSPIFSRRTVSSIYSTFNRAGLLRPAAYVDEAFESDGEFGSIQNAIKKRNYRNYIRGREYANKTAGSISDDAFNMRPLSSFIN